MRITSNENKLVVFHHELPTGMATLPAPDETWYKHPHDKFRIQNDFIHWTFKVESYHLQGGIGPHCILTLDQRFSENSRVSILVNARGCGPKCKRSHELKFSSPPNNCFLRVRVCECSEDFAAVDDFVKIVTSNFVE